MNTVGRCQPKSGMHREDGGVNLTRYVSRIARLTSLTVVLQRFLNRKKVPRNYDQRSQPDRSQYVAIHAKVEQCLKLEIGSVRAGKNHS